MTATNRPDAWQSILEERVRKLEQKHECYKINIEETIERFKKWVSTADTVDLYYDAESRAKAIADAREAYKAVWHELRKAKSELAEYKETMSKEV